MNTFGTLFRLTTFGESHGPALGAVVDGCPAGAPLLREDLQRALARRRPGQSDLTTPRREPDEVEILSGVYEGKTLGTPIAAVVRNRDARPEDYARLAHADRPGHGDAVWRARYGHRDPRGGGRTSGRETLSRVIGGAVAEAMLRVHLPQARLVAWVSKVAELEAPSPEADLSRAAVDAHPTRCPDPAAAEAFAERIRAAKEEGDSLGGAIDLRIEGLPVGLGEPVFDKLKARLAAAMMSIGAATGVILGPPDLPARLERTGSSFHADPEAYGGIQAGLANGRPVSLRILFKPPATLGEHARAGRHDPCILPRVVPVVEAMALLVVADLWLTGRGLPHQP